MYYFIVTYGGKGTGDIALSFNNFPSRDFICETIKQKTGFEVKSIRSMIKLNKFEYAKWVSGIMNDEVKPLKEEIAVDWLSLMNMFNKYSGVIPKINEITDARKKAVLTIISKHSKEVVREVIKDLINQPHLQGDNNRGWVASFDFIFKPANFIKIIEGNYKKKETKPELL